MFKLLFLQRRIATVFMAKGVNLRGASLIRFGKGVTLERGVIIDGLMRRGVVLGDNVKIGAYSVIVGAPASNLGEGISMGANSAVDAYSFLGSSGFISIGENVIMGQHVGFHPENHNFDRTDIPIREQGTTRQGITIEDDVWVGSNAIFLDGAHVGKGCVIGAGSVVRGNIPPYSIAVGVPGKSCSFQNARRNGSAFRRDRSGLRPLAMKNFFRVALSLGVLAGLVLLERKRPLRRERESKLRRNGRNLAVAALGALTVHLLEAPAVQPLARSVGQRKLGLLKQLNLPRPLEIVCCGSADGLHALSLACTHAPRSILVAIPRRASR